MGLSSHVTGTESVPTMKSGHKVGLRVKRLILSDSTKLDKDVATIVLQITSVQFQEYPSSGNRVVPCGLTDIHDEE